MKIKDERFMVKKGDFVIKKKDKPKNNGGKDHAADRKRTTD